MPRRPTIARRVSLTGDSAGGNLAINAAYRFQHTGLTVDEILERPEPRYWISSPYKGELLEEMTPLSKLPGSLPIPLPYTEIFGLGCIRACRDLARDYALERHSFGGPIGRKQAIAFMVADLDVMAHTAGLLVYAAARLKDDQAGDPDIDPAELKRAAAIAKLYTSESAVTAARLATQVFGGYGFMEEYPVARFYRDAKVLEIGEGTSEIQRLLIARGLGLPVE